MSKEELIEEMMESLDLQNNFILKMFGDDRINDKIKYEYAKEYNKLGINNYKKMAEHGLI